MKKLSMIGIIGGAALLTAAPFSLQWSQRNLALSLDSADARIGRPLTATSVAGVHEGFTDEHIVAQFTEAQWLDRVHTAMDRTNIPLRPTQVITRRPATMHRPATTHRPAVGSEEARARLLSR
jgi:hypothetical protein